MKKSAPKKKAAGKKPVRKVAKKATALKAPIKKTPKTPKPVGAVTHFFAEIKVAIVRFNQPVALGTEIGFRGATTDFNQKIVSMQFDHKPVLVAKKGKEIGIKVSKRVREGDSVFLVS